MAAGDPETAASYAVLPGADGGGPAGTPGVPRRPVRLIPLALLALFIIALLAGRPVLQRLDSTQDVPCEVMNGAPPSRGVSDGVSDKSAGGGAFLRSGGCAFPWTNDMLLWQRTSFHFQPQKNWMNDPNGPMFYKGWYHLFYQYNPNAAVWGNITWGHAVSRDLLHWLHLPPAMSADRWYDAAGVWTGSATLLPNGRIVMLYTGSTNNTDQVQNIAVPADASDPLLINWVKSDANPVLRPPPTIRTVDFRDPTTAWYDPSDSTWRFAIGSKDVAGGSHDGFAYVYKTNDFVHYNLIPGFLHRVNGTGMWECVDFYPVSATSAIGLDTSEPAGPGVKHVLKASRDDDMHDYYSIGTYVAERNEWRPDDVDADVGVGWRYDWGKFYASKTFYDPSKRRRVVWAWVGETDSERDDVRKGWASLQSIPRTVVLDLKTGSNLLQWPVEEVESLRISSKNLDDIRIDSGTVLPLDIPSATQLDIEAEFEIEAASLEGKIEFDVDYNCSTSHGSAGRGALGPFGLLVLADQDRSEQTATYFYVIRGIDGRLRTHFCQDETRSSKATDILKTVVGSTVPVLTGEKFSLRILVDHSIVESFAQGGRSCITSRVYPTSAISDAARVFLFNNATNAYVTAKSLKIWEMNSTFIHPYSTQI